MTYLVQHHNRLVTKEDATAPQTLERARHELDNPYSCRPGVNGDQKGFAASENERRRDGNGGFVPRRDVVKLWDAGGWSFTWCSNVGFDEESLSARRPALSNALLADISPIDRSLGDMAPAKFLVGRAGAFASSALGQAGLYRKHRRQVASAGDGCRL